MWLTCPESFTAFCLCVCWQHVLDVGLADCYQMAALLDLLLLYQPPNVNTESCFTEIH